MVSEEVRYFKEKPQNLNKKRAILGGCILLLVLVVLGYFGFFRPVIVKVPCEPGIYIKNEGGMDALIYKIDGFWYRAGRVAVLANIPEIRQRVEPGGPPVRLQVPDIPVPEEKTTKKTACYMRLAVRYGIPGIPIFRYTVLMYFKYDPNRKIWAATKSIPVKFRSVGNLAVGNIGEIKLSFH